MSLARKGERLSRSAREGALDLARRATIHERQGLSAKMRNQAFSNLPSFQRMRALRQILKGLDIADPYHRLHSGHATTRSTVDGQACLNFSSYDYLGLNADPRPVAAAQRALEAYGVSASASRMVAGDRPVHRALEAALSDHYSAQAAQVFVSGHATNVSVIGALLREGDAVIHDSFVHNSVSVGARLSPATRRSFPHADMDALESLLEAIRADHRNVLVVVEGLYSMDGDLPDLPRLIELKRRFGFWLMVDEAHALGPVGVGGRGCFEHFGCDPSDVDIWMGTLSKTLASTGGYIAGSADLIEFLRYNADGFVYSVALAPVLAASALAALNVMHAEPNRAASLQAVGRHFLAKAADLGLNTGLASGYGVLPVIVGDSALATKLSERMLLRGINVAPVTFPGVPMQSARLRFFLSSGHTIDQVDFALETLRSELDQLNACGFTEKIARSMAAIGLGGDR